MALKIISAIKSTDYFPQIIAGTVSLNGFVPAKFKCIYACIKYMLRSINLCKLNIFFQVTILFCYIFGRIFGFIILSFMKDCLIVITFCIWFGL